MANPSTTNMKNLAHLVQLIRQDGNEKAWIKKFDYGGSKNLHVYGQVEPPILDMGLIKIPLSVYYG